MENSIICNGLLFKRSLSEAVSQELICYPWCFWYSEVQFLYEFLDSESCVYEYVYSYEDILQYEDKFLAYECEQGDEFLFTGF